MYVCVCITYIQYLQRTKEGTGFSSYRGCKLLNIDAEISTSDPLQKRQMFFNCRAISPAPHYLYCYFLKKSVLIL